MKHDAGYILFGRVQESFTNQTTPEHPGMKRMGPLRVQFGCAAFDGRFTAEMANLSHQIL